MQVEDNDIVQDETPVRGGRFAAAEALFRKPTSPDADVETAVETAATELVQETEIQPGAQQAPGTADVPSTTEGRRILPNLTQAPDPVEQMLAEQPARKPRGRRPKSTTENATLPLDLGTAQETAAETMVDEPEAAEAPIPISQAQTPSKAQTRLKARPPNKLGYVARRQQTARSRYDRSAEPAFSRGESWKKRLPRFAR